MGKKLTKSVKTTLLISAAILIVILISVFIYWTKSTDDSDPRFNIGSIFTESESDYDIGFHDGFKETYLRLCQSKTYTVEGKWNNKDYQEGYQHGQLSGASKCEVERQHYQKDREST